MTRLPLAPRSPPGAPLDSITIHVVEPGDWQMKLFKDSNSVIFAGNMLFVPRKLWAALKTEMEYRNFIRELGIGIEH